MVPYAIEAITRKVRRTIADRGLSLFVLVTSCCSQGLVLLLVGFGWQGVSVWFGLEFYLCIGISIALDIAGFCVRRVIAFRLIHAIRFFMLLVAVVLLGGKSILIPILVVVPYFAESVMYDTNRIGITVNGFCLLITICVFSAQLWESGLRTTAFFLAIYTTIAGLSATFVCMLVICREKLVDAVGRARNLSSTVASLSDANKAFQLYADHIETKTAEKERQRITLELHDTVGYALTNVIVMMNAAKVLVQEDPGALDDLFDRLRNQSEEALNETRQTLYLLRNIHSIEPKGLKAISQLINGFQGATGIEIELNMGNLPWTFGQRLDSALFRLVQEGLTNSFRHGKATKVSINMWQSDDEIRVSIRDNGSGNKVADSVEAGIGLTGMGERFASLGGTVRPRNVADGFELQATIPFRMRRRVGTYQSIDS
jgi:signal transduction histidine kinase